MPRKPERLNRHCPDNSLQPAYSGIRPKITGPTEPAADFIISGPTEHGVPGLVNLFGIESPGADQLPGTGRADSAATYATP
jgi:L-2-hydroxyglutarate oxidase LhgO